MLVYSRYRKNGTPVRVMPMTYKRISRLPSRYIIVPDGVLGFATTNTHMIGKQQRPNYGNWGREPLDYCKKCLKTIYNQKVIDYSKAKHGKTFCYNCQKKLSFFKR